MPVPRTAAGRRLLMGGSTLGTQSLDLDSRSEPFLGLAKLALGLQPKVDPIPVRPARGLPFRVGPEPDCGLRHASAVANGAAACSRTCRPRLPGARGWSRLRHGRSSLAHDSLPFPSASRSGEGYRSPCRKRGSRSANWQPLAVSRWTPFVASKSGAEANPFTAALLSGGLTPGRSCGRVHSDECRENARRAGAAGRPRGRLCGGSGSGGQTVSKQHSGCALVNRPRPGPRGRNLDHSGTTEPQSHPRRISVANGEPDMHAERRDGESWATAGASNHREEEARAS
jgi:hypothetical protein